MKIENIPLPDIPLVFAVSGGVDSMVLLHLAMSKISKKHIFVAHFNHSLRGEESDADEIFVKNFCKKHHISFFSEKKDIANVAKIEKMSIEAAARKCRYEFLSTICEQNNAAAICTAHHLDDRIETAIFNLIRGAKLSGFLALKSEGILEIFEKKIHIKRPMIACEKSEILAFAREKNIDFREDSSNSDTVFQRNLLRNEVLPQFEKINANYRNALENFMKYLELLA